MKKQTRKDESGEKSASIETIQTVRQDVTTLVHMRPSNRADEEDVKEHLERLADFFIMDFYRQATKKENETYKIRHIKTQAAIFLGLLIRSARKTGTKFSEIKNLKHSYACIKEAIGVTALQDWLSKQSGRGVKIISGSGQERMYAWLDKLSWTEEMQGLYSRFDLLEKTVRELFDWMRMVKLLNESFKNKPSMALLTSSVGESGALVWKRDRVYLTLIINMTMDWNKTSFKLDDLLSFSRAIAKLDWKEKITEKFKAIHLGEGQSTVSLSKTVMEIIDHLSKSENQTPLYMCRKVSLSRTDLNLMRKFMSVVDQAASHTASQRIGASSFKNKSSKGFLDRAKERIYRRTKNMKADDLYNFLVEHAHFMFWISPKEFSRLAVLDAIYAGVLEKALTRFGMVDGLKAEKKRVSENFSLAQMLFAYWTDKKPYGFDFEFLHYNRQMFQKGSKFQSKEEISSILIEEISLASTPGEFSKWVSGLQKFEISIPLGHLTPFRVLAYYLDSKDEDVPDDVRATVELQQWFPYMTENIRDYFESKVNTFIKQRTTEANSNLTDSSNKEGSDSEDAESTVLDEEN